MKPPLRRRASRLSAAATPFLVLGLFAGGTPAVAAPPQEATLAEITDHSVDRTAVDVSDGAVDAKVTLELAGNDTDVTPWILAKPADYEGDLLGFDMKLTEGNEVNGTWELVLSFEEDSFEGDWNIRVYGLTEDGTGEGIDLGNVTVTGSANDADGGPGVIDLPSDVVQTAWHFPSVLWMIAAEITLGHADGTFRPNDAVTRGEAVAFLYRWSREGFEAPDDARFDDVPTTHHFHEAIGWAFANKVVLGYNADTFVPGQGMSRGEVAAILYRHGAPDDYTAPDSSELDDVVKGQTPHYDAITWLHSEGIASGRANGTFDPGARVTRAEFAAMLDRYDTMPRAATR
jgi:hypothetical protein